MASEAQIAANRRNIEQSTGPRSVEGKAASSMNALTTGIHAQSAIIRGEDPAALDTLTAEYYATHAPFTAEERFHVDSMIRFDWQLRRLTRIEAELYLLDPPRPIGRVYAGNSAIFARLTRQIATIQRCFRDASGEFKSLRGADPQVCGRTPVRPLPDPGKTNPIPTPEPAISITSEGGPAPQVCSQTLVAPCETKPILTAREHLHHILQVIKDPSAPTA